MSQADFDALLNAIDRMIQISEPRAAEYYRGYRRGLQLSQSGMQDKPLQEPYPFQESCVNSGDHYVDSYARGYRDGCKGLTPNP